MYVDNVVIVLSVVNENSVNKRCRLSGETHCIERSIELSFIKPAAVRGNPQLQNI